MSALLLFLLLTAAGPVERPRDFYPELEVFLDKESEDLETRDHGEGDYVDIDLFEERVSSSMNVSPLRENEHTGRNQLGTDAERDTPRHKSSTSFQETFKVDTESAIKTWPDSDSVSNQDLIDSDQQDGDDPSAIVSRGTQGTAYRRIRSVLLMGDVDSLDKNGVASKTSNLDNTLETVSRNHTFNDVPRFDPWLFETKIDENPDTSVQRLYLASLEIEQYIESVDRKNRHHNVNFSVMDVKYTHQVDGHSAVYKRPRDSSERIEAADDPGTPLSPPTMDCHFLWAYQQQWVKLVATCPQQWEDDTTRRQCVDDIIDVGGNIIDILSLPVQDDDGIVYKNIFCAECNNALQTHSWDVSMICDSTTSVFFINGNVALSLMPELTKSSHCRQTLIPSQPMKIEKCHSIMRRSRVRRNVYSDKSLESETYPVSFSLLMNFGFDGKTHILFKSTSQLVGSYTGNTCLESHQIWDNVNERCRTILCVDGYNLIDNTCIRDPSVPRSSFQNDLNYHTVSKFSDVAVITLFVNLSSNNLTPDIKMYLVESLAILFNISSERIQNLTIERVNGTHLHGSQFVIRPLNHKGFPSEEDDIHYTKEEKETTHTPIHDADLSSQTDEKFKLSLFHKRRGRKPKVNGTHLKKRHPKFENKSPAASVSYKTILPSFGHHKKDSSTKHNPSKKNETMTYRINFLLLPARLSTLQEGTVSSMREKIDGLFQQNKLHLTLNGTQLTVIDIVKIDKRSITNDTFCPKGKWRFYSQNEVDLIKGTNKLGNVSILHLLVNSTNTIYGPGKYNLFVWIMGKVGTETNLTGVMDYAVVCHMPKIVHSDCTRYEFEMEDYKLLVNSSILLSNRLYNMSEYEYREEKSGTIEICVPDSDLYPANMVMSYLLVHGCVEGFEKFILASAYMTAILGRISIVALAVVFITYCLLPQLRNLPGVNTMNLTLSLLIAESVFMIGEGSVDIPWVCSLVSILLHYFFLASFFWMNVMSFDVFRTFANDTCALPHIREKSKHLLKYVLYSWGSPAVIVGVCMLLDFTKIIPSVDIGYGRHHSEKAEERNGVINESIPLNKTKAPDNVSFGCWIQNPVATLAAFGAPIVLILLVNIYLFVKTILCIRKTAKFTNDNTRRPNLTRHNGRNDVILYVRMSTVMGFTWLFGLASSMISAITTTSSDVICYTEHVIGLLFVIFNCSQGLFIFFAFVTKKRVFFLYKTLWIRTRQKMLRRRLNRQRYISNSGSNSSKGSTTTVSTITSMNPGFT